MFPHRLSADRRRFFPLLFCWSSAFLASCSAFAIGVHPVGPMPFNELRSFARHTFGIRTLLWLHCRIVLFRSFYCFPLNRKPSWARLHFQALNQSWTPHFGKLVFWDSADLFSHTAACIKHNRDVRRIFSNCYLLFFSAAKAGEPRLRTIAVKIPNVSFFFISPFPLS